MKFTVKNVVATLAVVSSLSLVGCGGGGGSSSSDGGSSSSSNSNSSSSSFSSNQSQASEANLQQGQFVDSAVAGLWYETETQQGFTDANGFFNFLAGETVSFYLGQTLLGSVDAKSLVTPLDMVDDDDHPDKLQNMLRILQTLDADADTSNGIEINDVTGNYLDQFELPLNNPAVLFEASSVVSEIISAVTNGSDLINAVDSFVHFRETLLSQRRDTQGEIILNFLDTTWDAEISSTICDAEETTSLVYNFNIFGVTTIGNHRLVEVEDDFGDFSCQGAGNGILFSTYETDELFVCANECTEEDLNRVIVGEDDLGDVVTTMTYDEDDQVLTINVSYFDGEETQTTSTVLTKRS